jgi:hypothetical protein
MTDRLEGSYGYAEKIPVPDMPEAAGTLCLWLLTAPLACPAWWQYRLGVVRLRDGVPGFPPPSRQFDGATHELNVVALDPANGTLTAADMERLTRGSGLRYLTPASIAHQIEGTDAEAEKLAGSAALAVVHGWLWPETINDPVRIREDWKASLVKTLAHHRGEIHAP